jgi:hypothetical protein
MKNFPLCSRVLLAVLTLALGAGCSGAQQLTSSNQGYTGGTDTIISEAVDTAPDARCAKPDSRLLERVDGDEVGHVSITTSKQDGKVQSVPISLTYVEYQFDSSGNTYVAELYDLPCEDKPVSESHKSVTYRCGLPVETSPVSQPVQFQTTPNDTFPMLEGQMAAQAQQIVFKNPNCEREVVYQQRFVSYTGEDTYKTGLDGTPFPLYYNSAEHSTPWNAGAR